MRRIPDSHWNPVAFSALICVSGCSGTGPATAGAGDRSLDPAPTSIQVADTVTLALKAHSRTPIAVRTMPNAACVIAEGDPKHKFFADRGGVVRIQVNPTEERTGTLSLDCRTQKGTSRRFALEITGTTDAAAIAETAARMEALKRAIPGVQRAALEGDPMSYTQQELTAHGYGRRPDPAAHPDRYAHWVRAVQQPMTVVNDHVVPGELSNGPNENQTWNSNWSGGVATNPKGAWPSSTQGSYFWYASAEWYVPQVYALQNNLANQQAASTWVGLGGVAPEALWQAGTYESTETVLFFETASYGAWSQLAPLESEQSVISGFAVDNGDDIFVEVYQCNPNDDSENPTPTGQFGYCSHLINYTQNEEHYDTRWETFLFGTAEAIQERPGNVGGGQPDYPQFDPFSFISTQVCSSDGNNFVGGCNEIGANGSGFLPGQSPFGTEMWQIGSPDHPIGESCMADGNGTCTDDGDYVRVWFVNHS